jgi:hypothetical protein
MSICETNRLPLTGDLDALLRKSLKRAMLSRGINEEDLAAELTSRLGRTVNRASVNAWKAETKIRWHLPANLVPLICEILGDDSIQRLLLSEKLKQSLDLGESTPRIVSLLRRVLPRRTVRKKGQSREKRTRKA